MIPQHTVGYVTGRDRATLSALEEETWTLMFFSDKSLKESRQENEKLIIVGPERGRKKAEFKIMSAIESKSPGHYINGSERDRFYNDDALLGTSLVKMNEGQFTYALGRHGMTRRKLEIASGAILEYVGFTAFIGGSKYERRRAKEYLLWLLDQKDGKVVVDTRGRCE